MIVQQLPPTWWGQLHQRWQTGSGSLYFHQVDRMLGLWPPPPLGQLCVLDPLWVDCLSDLGIRESTWCSTAQCLLTEALLISPETLTCHQMPCASHRDVSPYFLHPLGLASVFNCHFPSQQDPYFQGHLLTEKVKVILFELCHSSRIEIARTGNIYVTVTFSRHPTYKCSSL